MKKELCCPLGSLRHTHHALLSDRGEGSGLGVQTQARPGPKQDGDAMAIVADVGIRFEAGHQARLEVRGQCSWEPGAVKVLEIVLKYTNVED